MRIYFWLTFFWNENIIVTFIAHSKVSIYFTYTLYFRIYFIEFSGKEYYYLYIFYIFYLFILLLFIYILFIYLFNIIIYIYFIYLLFIILKKHNLARLSLKRQKEKRIFSNLLSKKKKIRW